MFEPKPYGRTGVTFAEANLNAYVHAGESRLAGSGALSVPWSPPEAFEVYKDALNAMLRDPTIAIAAVVPVSSLQGIADDVVWCGILQRRMTKEEIDERNAEADRG